MDAIINILLFGLVAIFLINKFLPVKGVKQISTAQLKDELKRSDLQFIDVRTSGEFASNHIKKFKNIPLHEISNKVNQLSKEKEVVVICQSGMRSNKATKILKKMGFNHISNVKGGMSAWH
ncbi:rhodanese [Alkalihalophilus pseudofirmus]|nr:rhodanese [Alkalihalophilus pseudofirmus]